MNLNLTVWTGSKDIIFGVVHCLIMTSEMDSNCSLPGSLYTAL